jgi:hypothetical protein
MLWIRIRIQGFDDQKLRKNTSDNFLKSFFDKKNCTIYLSLGFHKDVKAAGEAFSPQKRASST